MLVLTMLFLTLDFQRLTIPDEAMTKSFVVSPLQNEALTGCTTNPHSGRSINTDLLAADGIKAPEYDTQHATTWPSSLSGTENGYGITPSMLVSPGRNITPVNPDPRTPPVPIVPEPSTVAILGITAAVLIFLLFGERRFVRH